MRPASEREEDEVKREKDECSGLKEERMIKFVSAGAVTLIRKVCPRDGSRVLSTGCFPNSVFVTSM